MRVLDATRALAWLPLCLAACLGPPDESVPLDRLLGPVDFDIAEATSLEQASLPNLDATQLARNVAYLKGYADGQPVGYWNVDGANARFIAPVYVVQNDRGEPQGPPIIDVVPGDSGYTPWWRIHIVRTTASYAGEAIWSRAAIDAAVQAGLLLEPQPTSDVVNCPVVAEGTAPEPGRAYTPPVTPVWYRGLRASWIRFPGETTVAPTSRTMPIFPVYVLQRINEALPLYEFFTAVDIDGDEKLDNSNNVFASGVGGPRYSPLWEAVLVRVSADYPSIDTSSAAVGIQSEQDLWNPDGTGRVPFVVSSSTSLGLIVNCPIEGPYP